MAVNCLICFLILVIFTVSSNAEMISISGTLAHSRSFYYRQLSKYPAKKVTLELSVLVLQTGLVHHKLDFYMFSGKFKPERNCSYQKFGQLRNEDLHMPLRFGPYRFVKCKDIGNLRRCHGRTTIQDFIPRNVAFSIGISCDNSCANCSDNQGVSFNISLYDATNHTQCMHTGHWIEGCYNYYTHMTFPNLVGDQVSRDAYNTFRGLDGWLRTADPSYPEFQFYQHFHELMCYTFTPRCDPQTGQMVPPCREACLDFLQGCIAHFGEILVQTEIIAKHSKIDISQVANCDYLPDANGTLPCFYKRVTCSAPPTVTNALLVNMTNLTRSYHRGSAQEYTCLDEYDRKGNNSVTCLYSGQWSETPVCEKTEGSYIGSLPIVLPILIVPLILFISLIIRYTCSKNSVLQYFRRDQMYDAFVCYDIDDADYAHETIIDELEVKCDPQFQLCIHKRDFMPPYTIKYNIWHAIKNSNSAIIVMSQSYVDSIWCRDEFEGCYVENLEDPAFGIFVIMMQPVNTLERTDEYMKSFFTSRTYLEKNDPKVFEKIAKYLYKVKQPNLSEECVNDKNIVNDNTGDTVDHIDETVEML